MTNRERLSEIEWRLCEREVQYVDDNGYRDNTATDDMTFLLQTVDELMLMIRRLERGDVKECLEIINQATLMLDDVLTHD
jgi:hypothetical protein